jgi:hypothetical protein
MTMNVKEQHKDAAATVIGRAQENEARLMKRPLFCFDCVEAKSGICSLFTDFICRMAENLSKKLKNRRARVRDLVQFLCLSTVF